jgi:hypothetical protein
MVFGTGFDAFAGATANGINAAMKPMAISRPFPDIPVLPARRQNMTPALAAIH